MRHIGTLPGMGGGKIKENDGGVNSTMIYCKNFCKYHNNNIRKKRERPQGASSSLPTY
jgi:hypothetical protein